jgi:hypothetical protein
VVLVGAGEDDAPGADQHIVITDPGDAVPFHDVLGLRRASAIASGQVVHDNVADHCPVAVAQRRVGEVAAEERAEGVAMGKPEDAERADHHVHIDRIRMPAEIGTSLSPQLHEREADELGLRYLYQLIAIDELGVRAAEAGSLLAEARRMGFRGLNITHPCKQVVVRHLDELSPAAADLLGRPSA